MLYVQWWHQYQNFKGAEGEKQDIFQRVGQEHLKVIRFDHFVQQRALFLYITHFFPFFLLIYFLTELTGGKIFSGENALPGHPLAPPLIMCPLSKKDHYIEVFLGYSIECLPSPRLSPLEMFYT